MKSQKKQFKINMSFDACHYIIAEHLRGLSITELEAEGNSLAELLADATVFVSDGDGNEAYSLSLENIDIDAFQDEVLSHFKTVVGQ